MFPSAYNKKNDEESCTEVLHSKEDTKENYHYDLSQHNQFQPPRNDEDDLFRVIQDLQETVAMIAKKQETNETRMEEQVALMSRKIENSQEHFEDDQQQISPVSENPKAKGIDEDTFSIMMTSKVCSVGWVLGLGTFAFQMILIVIILIGYFQLSKGSTPFDAPIRVTIKVRIGQFFAVILSLLSQQDIFTAIDSLIAFRSSSPENNDTGFYRLLVDDNDEDASQRENGKECATWFLRAILPNFLKLTQGISVLFVSLIVIIQSDDLIGLLRDFTALYFLSEIDNIFFRVASQGYFGENLKARTEKVKNVKYDVKVHNLEDMTSTTTSAGVVERFKRHLKHFVLFALAAVMFSCLIYVAIGQTSGTFVKKKYPDCKLRGISPLDIGDKTCNGILNNVDCGFDGNDCAEYNLNYPGCRVNDTNLVGDGFCNGGVYDTIQCVRDGGDCERCPDVPNSEKNTMSIATGDFNNDSYVDIIFGNCGLSNQLLLNNGDGTFGNAIDLPGGNYKQCTTSIAAADLDGDGLIDIVVGRQFFDFITYYYASHRNNTILWNKGNDTFIEQHLLNGDEVDTQAIEVADLDNNSFPDIIFGNSNTDANTIMWNQGNKEFIEKELPQSKDYDTRSVSVLFLADAGGNPLLGQAAILFGNYNQQNMYYWSEISDDMDFDGPIIDDLVLGTNAKKTIAMTIFTTTTPFSLFTVALNEDGDHETFKSAYGGGDGVYPLLDNQDMNEARCIETADMNNNRLVDLVTGHSNGESNRVFFLSTRTDRTFPAIQSSIELPCTLAMNTNAIALADLDNDGNMDVIIGNSMQMNQVLLNFLGDGMTYKQSGDDPRGSVWLPENSVGSTYPDCKARNPSNIGNGNCDNNDSFINAEACGYDGGDCDEFNARYPDCEIPDPFRIGDLNCDNSAPYNSEACGYDGGDCVEFYAKYPDCTAENTYLIGDGICDNSDPYNSEACGFDGGDCL